MIQIFADLNTTAPVGVLTWLDDPELLAKLWQLIKDSRFVGISGIIIELLKLQELRIIQPLLDVVSEWQALPVVSANGLIIDFHVVIDGFLIA